MTTSCTLAAFHSFVVLAGRSSREFVLVRLGSPCLNISKRNVFILILCASMLLTTFQELDNVVEELASRCTTAQERFFK
jgi:hypothetical protein